MDLCQHTWFPLGESYHAELWTKWTSNVLKTACTVLRRSFPYKLRFYTIDGNEVTGWFSRQFGSADSIPGERQKRTWWMVRKDVQVYDFPPYRGRTAVSDLAGDCLPPECDDERPRMRRRRKDSQGKFTCTTHTESPCAALQQAITDKWLFFRYSISKTLWFFV